MQQDENIQRGEIGEKTIDLFFATLGWGPLPTGRQDLGTDFFVQIRDTDRIDLRLMIGVQVKTGASGFSEEAEVNGRKGWWFRDSKKHADYWINHHVPHIVVLLSANGSTSAWASLDSRSIIDTGKGMKVFVPTDQVLESSRAGDWIALAAEARKLISFEGSRWSFDITQLPPKDWPRHALIAPRLITPHINRGYSNPINWAESIALCIEASPERWYHFAARHTDVPSPENATTSEDPGWRLAGAIYRWVTGEDDGALEQFDKTSASPEILAAHAVCLSIALVDDDRQEQAIRALDEVAVEDFTADDAWLGVHKARILAETGNVAAGLKLFQDVTVTLAGLKTDVTISAIRSAAIWAQFELTRNFDHDFSAVIPALDTAASWWRTQSTSAGLEDAVDRTFEVWAPSNVIPIIDPDIAHNELFSSALVARLAGDHSSWRKATTLMATVDLSTRRPQKGTPGSGLDALRRAGEHTKLGRAVRKTIAEGPLADVVILVADISLARMTKTTWRADLEVLRQAGRYASQPDGSQFVDFLIAALTDTGPLRQKANLNYTPEKEILQALEGLATHIDGQQKESLLEHILSLNEATSQGIEQEARQFLFRLPHELISQYRDRLEQRAVDLKGDGWLAKMFSHRADADGGGDPERRRQAILAGDVQALGSIASLGALRPDELEVMIEVCRVGFAGYRTNQNGLTLGHVDHSELCALLALAFPDSDASDVLIEFIQDRTAYAGLKRKGVKILADRVSQMPERYRTPLADSLRGLRLDPSPEGDQFDRVIPQIGGAFHELFLELSPEDPDRESALAAMLTGDEQSRFDAADYLSRHEGNELLLLSMTRDENFRVSHRSMLALARLISETADPEPTYVTALADLLQADGEANASFILSGLAARSPSYEHVKSLLALVEDHPSAAVRARVGTIRVRGND